MKGDNDLGNDINADTIAARIMRSASIRAGIGIPGPGMLVEIADERGETYAVSYRVGQTVPMMHAPRIDENGVQHGIHAEREIAVYTFQDGSTAAYPSGKYLNERRTVYVNGEWIPE